MAEHSSGHIEVATEYPVALNLIRQVKSDGLVLLHLLVCRSRYIDGELQAEAGVRDLADAWGVVSKDTVHRRLRDLRRAGVIDLLPPTLDPTAATKYRIHLPGTGLRNISPT